MAHVQLDPVRVVWLRQAQGLSQPQLAERAGVAKGTVANIEQGLRRTTRSAARAIADALGVDLEEIARLD